MESQCSDVNNCRKPTVCSCLTTFSNVSACSALGSDVDLDITREQMMSFYATAHQHC